MIVVEFIIQIFFFEICGWVGHVVVKAAKFINVDLDFGRGSESDLNEWIGFFTILFAAGLIALILKM